MKTNIKQIRISQNYDTKAIAEKLNVSLRTYQNYENGTTEMPFQLLVKISNIFGCSIDYIIGNKTPGILHLDRFTKCQQKAIDMISQLNDDQTLLLLGYLARMTDTPLDAIMEE